MTLFVLAGLLAGCADLSLPGSSRIYEERVTQTATSEHMMVVSEPMVWTMSVDGNRYNFSLPIGTYSVTSRDEDYLYYTAPEPVSLGDAKLFANQDRRSYDGGIFIARNPRARYSSGAFIDQDGKKLLLLYFDARFTNQEGKRWHYVE